MKILLMLVVLSGLTLADDPVDYEQDFQQDIVAQVEQDSEDEIIYYHESVGIPMAEMMREYEETMRRQENAEDLDERIIGGTAVPAGIVPFIGGVNILLTDGNVSMCGSSLLKERWSVTAAHCWYDGKHQAVKFLLVHGSPTIYYGGVRTKTKRVTPHENYDWVKQRHDIAMIKHKNITFTPLIQPIPLARGNLQNNKFVNVWAQAAGYGLNATDKSGELLWEQPLRLVNVQVISNKKCARRYGNKITNYTICTRNGPRSKPLGTCGGDSGGPLTIEDNGKRYLIGVTAFGHKICEIWPSVYSRVTEYLDWIDSKM